MKTKTSILALTKAFFILLVSGCLLMSCTTKSERLVQIKTFYPKAEIIDVTTKDGSGWRFIVNDTITNRYLFIECYAGGDLQAKEFFLNNR